MPVLSEALPALGDRSRLAALAAARLLDTPPEQRFDRVTKAVKKLLGVPVALLSLVDDRRQYFMSAVGLPEPWASTRQTPLSHSMCKYVVSDRLRVVIEDARLQERYCSNLAVSDLGVVAYAGVPVRGSDAEVLGALCAIDTVPRAWSERDLLMLEHLAQEIEYELRLRRLRAATSSAMTDSREQAARITAVCPAILAVFEPATQRVTFVNDECRSVTGYTPAEIVGMGAQILPMLVDPADLPGVLRHVGQIMKLEPGETGSQEVRLRHKDGSTRFVVSRESVLARDGDGRVTQIIASAMDVTPAKRAEATHARQQDQLRQSQKLEALGNLAGGIAHDFNNILTSIVGNAQVAAENQTIDAGVREAIDEIKASAFRATGLVGRILSFARRQETRRQPVALEAIVRDGLRLLRRVLPAGIDVQIDLAPGLPLVLADVNQMHQILMNLGTNARDAMGGGGGRMTVSLTESRPGDSRPTACKPTTYVRLSTSDTGCGMDDETRRQLFDPFFTTKAPGAGTGLGMSIVYGIAQTHEAVIDVHSEVGAGTTISLYFPVLPPLPALPPG